MIIKLIRLLAVVLLGFIITACHHHNLLLSTPADKITQLLNSVDYDYIENCHDLFMGNSQAQTDEVIYNDCILQSEDLAKRANESDLIPGVKPEDFRDITFFQRVIKLNLDKDAVAKFMKLNDD